MPHEMTYPGVARTKPRRVFFSGTTALVKGQGLCYDRDYGTAASNEGERDTRVQLPDNTNNQFFAGVVSKDYAANAAGQWVEIYEPGSVCEIAIQIGTTVRSTRLTCSAATGQPGRFGPAGFPGRGTAVALQTITALTDDTASVGVISSSLDGTATVNTTPWKTISKAGLFANAIAGDYVYVIGGATTATMATRVTVGRYTIASVTDDDNAVMTTAITTVDSEIACYVVRGNPTCLAYLYDGDESGLTEWVTPYTDGSGTTPITTMVSGYTFLYGGSTLGTGNAIDTLADGLFIGMTKGYRLMGALATSDVAITVTTGKTYDPAGADFSNALGALGTLTFDTADEYWVGEWDGVAWCTKSFGPDNSATLS